MQEKRREKPKHLGRGLQSLLGSLAPDESQQRQMSTIQLNNESSSKTQNADTVYQEVLLDKIQANPHQARTNWDQADLSNLSESIKTNGIVQPIVVRPAEGGNYQIIAGERRFRAARMASLEKIPVFIRNATDEQLHEWSLVENIHRVDLNPIERAKAYREYLNAFSLSQTEAAERLGEDRSVVSNYLRLLDLPQDIKQMLIDGQLSMGHARAILALPNDELRRKLANRAMAGRLSVREVERLVRAYLDGNTKSNKTSRVKAPHILDMENRLRSQLGTKVFIETRKSGKKGKIIIEFYSLDEFDSITERLGITTLEEI